MINRLTYLIFLIVTLVVLTPQAQAQVSLQGGNLGWTSFMDGLGFPGFVSDQYFYINYSEHYTDKHGHNLPGTNKMHNHLLLTSFKYVAENPKILGAWPGIDIELPVMFDLRVKQSGRFNESETNAGDFFLGMFLQYPETKLFNRIPFWQRVELLMKFPTGHYKSSDYVNAGSNVFALNPYYAFTAFLTKKIELSMRFFYLWNAKNTDPSKIISPEWNPSSGLPPKFASTTQQGQAVWTNFASSYGITDNFRLGINGYYLEQITDHKVDGHHLYGKQERVVAIGPGMMYISDNKKNMCWLNFYDEVYSVNRAKGVITVIRWLHVF